MRKAILSFMLSVSFLLTFNFQLFAEIYKIKIPDIGVEYTEGHNNILTVTKVAPNSSADKAGVQINDRLSFYGTTPIFDLRIGEDAETTLYRGDKIKRVFIHVDYEEYPAYYNNNLKKIELPYQDSSPAIFQGYYGPNLTDYIRLLKIFAEEANEVHDLKVEPDYVRDKLLNAFYVMYDRSKKSKNENYKKIYALVNHLFYNYLSTAINNLSKKDDKSILNEESGQKFVEFIKLIFEAYYLPNYSDMPEFQNTYSQIKKFSASIAQNKQNEVQILAEKYKNSQGGWQYLKWGMSVDEVKTLLNKNGSGLKEGNNNFVILNISVNDSIQTDLIKEFYDNEGILYFYHGKLIGRIIDIEFNYYIEHHEFITQKLKEKYPEGVIYRKTGPGLGIVEYQNFKLETNWLTIFTLLAPPGYAGGGIYYYDPDSIEKLLAEIDSKERRNKREEEKEIEDKF